jgi:hypothetical protein
VETCAHFFAAGDLTFILHHKWSYPVANMCNDYRPFDGIETIEIDSLEEICNLDVEAIASLGIRDGCQRFLHSVKCFEDSAIPSLMSRAVTAVFSLKFMRKLMEQKRCI